MKRNFVLLILILMFGILKGQSNYEKYALPVFKKTNDTANSSFKKNLNPPVLGTPAVVTGQSFGGNDIQVFPSDTIQSEVHISFDDHNPSHLLISANTLLSSFGFVP